MTSAFLAEPSKQQDEKALALVERQNSGSHAESHAAPSKAKPGQLPYQAQNLSLESAQYAST